MVQLKRLVLDVLKPHDPDLVTFARQVGDAGTVETTTATLVEIDERVKTIELTVEGTDLDFGVVERVIDDLGGSIHSIDEVVCGRRGADESQ